jgi:hypothetical protein
LAWKHAWLSEQLVDTVVVSHIYACFIFKPKEIAQVLLLHALISAITPAGFDDDDGDDESAR